MENEDAMLNSVPLLRTILLVAILIALTACTTVANDLGTPVESIASAGVSTYERKQEHADGSSEHTKIALGKEVDDWHAKFDLSCEDGSPIKVDIGASGVRAFEGQAIAADAVVAMRESLSERDRAVFDSLAFTLQQALTGYLSARLPSFCAALP